jgi:hypothetical protein
MILEPQYATVHPVVLEQHIIPRLFGRDSIDGRACMLPSVAEPVRQATQGALLRRQKSP